MKLERFGTPYGGWTIYPDLLPFEAGVVVDAGIGTDLSFSEALKEIRPNLSFIGIDHTDDSEKYVAQRAIPGFRYVKAALIGRNRPEKRVVFRNPKLGSESVFPDHRFVDPTSTYEVPAISIEKLLEGKTPNLIKLDIEGAEYEVLVDIITNIDLAMTPQICVEFHDRMMTRFSANDTANIISDLEIRGYVVAHRTPENEILFVRKDLLK